MKASKKLGATQRLFSAAARTLSLKATYSGRERAAYHRFCRLRWPQIKGRACLPSLRAPRHLMCGDAPLLQMRGLPLPIQRDLCGHLCLSQAVLRRPAWRDLDPPGQDHDPGKGKESGPDPDR